MGFFWFIPLNEDTDVITSYYKRANDANLVRILKFENLSPHKMGLFSVKGILMCYPLKCCPFEDSVSANTTEEPYLFLTIRRGGFVLSASQMLFLFWFVSTKLCSASGPNTLKF